MGARRKARECALMILYGMENSGHTAETALDRFRASFATGEALDPLPVYASEDAAREPTSFMAADGETWSYATKLVYGVSSAKPELDELIRGISVHWRLDRMASVDRNVLRLAAFEMTKFADSVPRRVAINEAIDLAKSYGTAESGAFVNGILDRIGTRD